MTRTFDADNIPEALKKRRQWLLWDEHNDSPRRPAGWSSGRLDWSASWRAPNDWLTFNEAAEAAETRESIGIGYVLHESDDFGVLDLDGCLRGEGGPKEWLPELDPFLGETYIDVSPSGAGAHVWFANDETDGGIPSWWSDQHLSENEHEGIEAYSAKFMTVTGDRLFDGRGKHPPEFATTQIGTIDADTLDGWLRDAWSSINGKDANSTPWNTEVTTQTPGERRTKPVPQDLDEWFDESEAKDALSHIDADVEYPTWRNVGFALADHFSEGTARRLFEHWSQGGSKWDAEAKRLAGDIVSRDESGVGVGTLIEHAKDGGWDASEAASEVARERSQMSQERADEILEGIRTGDGAEADVSDVSDVWDGVRSAYGDDGTSTAAARQAAVDALLALGDYVTPRDSNHLWSYHAPDGVFERGGQRDIERVVERELGAFASNYEVKEIVSKIKRRTQIERDAFDAGDHDENLVCVANGVLNLETRELSEHSPEYRFRTALPVAFDPKASGEAIEDFLADVTRRPEDAATLLEFVGYALWPDHSIRGAFAMLIGEGSNGKGVFEKVVNELLGAENVSGVELQRLTDNRFAAANLENKLANIGSDIPSAKVSDLSIVKAITGGDRIHVERKHEQGYETDIRAKPMFSVNNAPVFAEQTHAVARRVVPIPFPFRFTHADDEHKDARDERELMDELTTDEALSGFLNAALEGLDRLRETGDFSLPESPSERMEVYEAHSDPIAQFAATCLENVSRGYVTKDATYAAYVELCRENGESPKAKGTFFRELARTSFAVDSARPRYGMEERATALESAALTAKGRELCPKSSLQKSDRVNEHNEIDPRPRLSMDKEGPNGASQSELVSDVRKAIRISAAPTVENVVDVLVFQGYDRDRVAHAVDELRTRGEIAEVAGSLTVA